MLLDDKIDNIYERYKVLYGLENMFPNLQNKKIYKINYNDIINTDFSYNINNKYYKIIEIDFSNESIYDIDETIKKINKFFNNKKDLTNIEILSFINFNFVKTNNESNNIDNITSNCFSCFENLKEFLINNKGNNCISNLELFINKNEYRINNKFVYFYLGYDINNNLIFYRNGINKIKSLDILDIFKFHNNKIVKLVLLGENIILKLNEEKTDLKIINTFKKNKLKDNTRHPENYYYFNLNYLSEFIYNLLTLNSLTIDGFDFNFNEIQNKNVKVLSLNYFKELNGEFKFKIEEKNDINLKDKFPNLEEINFGKGEDYSKILSEIIEYNMIPKNLKKINFLFFSNLKKFQKILKKRENKIEINILFKTEDNENANNDLNNEELNSSEDDIEDNIYEDEDEEIIKINPKQKAKKHNKIIKKEESYEFDLQEMMKNEKNKDYCLKSKIIKTFEQFMVIKKYFLMNNIFVKSWRFYSYDIGYSSLKELNITKCNNSIICIIISYYNDPFRNSFSKWEISLINSGAISLYKNNYYFYEVLCEGIKYYTKPKDYLHLVSNLSELRELVIKLSKVKPSFYKQIDSFEKFYFECK